ncbi:DUF6112 family protein [Acidiferrimicrobium sp. IK]|uniref:DUF6112 family protein n=1 Tax=Acidiferrimicrobium sp. IK TaxID=2871700 RepID=UPI0021CB6097|nr:DUF6112 family protein [Acidiferrimicrobium sp. IK]MCU4186945.1 DUF6112 family protein [Acidiferrimicrobium sp. IK]
MLPTPLVTVAARSVRHVAVLVAAASPTAPPTTDVRVPAVGRIDPGAAQNLVVPGTTFLDNLASGLGTWALIASVIGIFAGGVIWAFGSYSQNYQQAYNGRKGVLVSGVAALLIGAGPHLIGFFYSQGSVIR